eukprot:403364886
MSRFTDEFCESINQELDKYEYRGLPIYEKIGSLEHEYLIKIRVDYWCKRCEREWSSNVGTCKVEWRLSKKKGVFRTHYQVLVYNQNCMECYKRGQMSVEDDQMERVARIFAREVDKSIDYEYFDSERYGSQDFYDEENEWEPQGPSNHPYHQQNLCQACKEGICENGDYGDEEEQ